VSEDRRVLRAEREIKQAMSELLINGLKFPLPGFASIANVDAGGDLRAATVYVRVAGTESERNQAEKLLLKQRGQIQSEIADRLQARYCPVLTFVVGGVPNDQVDDIEIMLANLNRRSH